MTCHRFGFPFPICLADRQDELAQLRLVQIDGHAAPVDVLAIINDINAHGSRSLPLRQRVPFPAGPFFDVDGNDQVSPSDVLAIINYINSRSFQGAGEGEAADLPSAMLPPADAWRSSPTDSFAAARSHDTMSPVARATRPADSDRCLIPVLPEPRDSGDLLNPQSSTGWPPSALTDADWWDTLVDVDDELLADVAGLLH